MRVAALVMSGLLGVSAGAWAQDTAADAKVAERAATSRVKGAESAPVTVYEIADFQCPFCSKFSREIYPRIDSAYVKTGKARWIFVNFPLPMHVNSWAAAEAALCAGGVAEKFWPMHDRVFANQAEWSALASPSAVFARYAREIGVPAAAYASCVAEDKMAPLLIRDLLNAAGSGVSGTPAFVINNEPIFAGYRPFEEWQELLEKALKKGK